MAKRIAILGSTGSIGKNTLDVIESLGADYQVVGLAASTSWQLLAKQANAYAPCTVAIADPVCADNLRCAVGSNVDVLVGLEGLVELVERSGCDCVVSAIVGSAGLPATLRAVELGLQVGLANKEALVLAGSLIIPQAKEADARLIPIDSEHSAIFQALHAGHEHEVRRLVLTASGGPFRTKSLDEIRNASLEDALNHPTWNMGPKITIDSATMMNKALEIIEAKWLFGVRADQISVVIHPESIIHSMVEFCDGSLVAQLGEPDMRTPIQYALTYPNRLPCPSKSLDLESLRQMNFEPPDFERFRALRLGMKAAEMGGTAGAVLNGANERCVEMFRANEIRFGEITDLTEEVVERHRCIASPSLDELLAADRWARDEVSLCLAS